MTFSVQMHDREPSGLDISINAHENYRVFEEAAVITFALIADIAHVSPKLEHAIVVAGVEEKDLLAAWVQSLLDLHEKEHLLLCRFRVDAIETHRIRGATWGERIDAKRHRLFRDASTLKLREAHLTPTGGEWTGYVTFDVPGSAHANGSTRAAL